MAELKYIKGDATDPIGTGPIFIPHVCNDIGAFGAGFAMALAIKWDHVKQAYLDKGDWALGTNIYVKATKDITICHMISQHKLVNKDNPHPLRYVALISCMKGVRGGIRVGVKENGLDGSIHTVKFGSGLAGGFWPVIEQLIKEIWVEQGIDVTIYEL